MNEVLDELPPRIDDLDDLLTDNDIIFSRTKGVSVLTPEQMLDASINGSDAAGSGCGLGLAAS